MSAQRQDRNNKLAGTKTAVFKIGIPDLIRLYASPLPRRRLAELPAEARRAWREETGERKWYITPAKQNKLRISKAIVLALAELAPKCLDCTNPQNLKKLRVRVAYHLTEDLLGRKRSSRLQPMSIEEKAPPKKGSTRDRRRAIAETLEAPAPQEAEAEAKLLKFSKLLSTLSQREADLLRAMFREHLSGTEAASRLGMKASTGRVLVFRIKKKAQTL